MTIPLTRFSEQIFRLCHYDYVSKKKFWKIFWIFFGIFLLNFFSGFFFDEKCYDLVLLTFRYNSKVDHLFLNRQPLGDSLRCYMEILFAESHWLELRKLLMFLFRHQILFRDVRTSRKPTRVHWGSMIPGLVLLGKKLSQVHGLILGHLPRV